MTQEIKVKITKREIASRIKDLLNPRGDYLEFYAEPVEEKQIDIPKGLFNCLKCGKDNELKPDFPIEKINMQEFENYAPESQIDILVIKFNTVIDYLKNHE